jgi:uncharacterized membrane protein YcaP (DUF421 family)
LTAVRRLVEPPPLTLVREGRTLRRNMRAQLVTEGELKTKLREQGIERLEQVKIARMEISVIQVEGAAMPPGQAPRE